MRVLFTVTTLVCLYPRDEILQSNVSQAQLRGSPAIYAGITVFHWFFTIPWSTGMPTKGKKSVFGITATVTTLRELTDHSN